MDPTIPPEEKSVSEVIQDTVEIVDQVSEYGSLITNSLYLILGGMLAIFVLHKLASKFVYPHLKNKRLIKVVFGTMYVLILVITVLVAFKELGYNVRVIGRISILIVLISAVVVFFLVPFLPRLPFKLGHMIEVNGVLGIVDGISTYHTTIRKFDGTTVFVPNALVMASKILNYNDLPERRIDLELTIKADSQLEEAKTLLLGLMIGDKRVLDEPSSPVVFIMNASAEGVEMVGYCWVKNADWLNARSDLWLSVVEAFIKDDRVTMSRPQQEVYVIDEKGTSRHG